MFNKSLLKLFGLADDCIAKLGNAGQKGTRQISDGLIEKLSKAEGFTKWDRAACTEQLHFERIKFLESAPIACKKFIKGINKIDPRPQMDDIIGEFDTFVINNLTHKSPSAAYLHGANNKPLISGFDLSKPPKMMSTEAVSVTRKHLRDKIIENPINLFRM